MSDSLHKAIALIFSHQTGGGKKLWTQLEHNGVVFAPLYKPHKIPIKYDGKSLVLPEGAEEYATLYARYLDTDYITSKFKKNFFNSWKPFIKDTPIKNMDLCDFTPLKGYKIPKSDPDNVDKYKIAVVDGKKQPVGNFRLEPPGIFIGRGCHPKIGTIKRRIMPKDLTINISKNAPIPPLPPHYSHLKYGKIIHDPYVEWLVAWKDGVTGKMKYVRFGHNSDFKAASDKEKFDKARRLGKNIGKIRKTIMNDMGSNDEKTKQHACALHFIDKLALRVGGEKGDDEADTVGVTSLRVEHITLMDGQMIQLDFLGKDSVRYTNKVHFDNIVYENVHSFMKGKNKSDSLFDKINSASLNAYIKDIETGMTAKVFRTYNSSITYQNELQKVKNLDGDVSMLMLGIVKANAKVALLCNHQKNINKNFKESVGKLRDQLKDIKNKIAILMSEKKGKYKEKVAKLKERAKKLVIKRDMKNELKNISLQTSKVNYIDPRITVAFLKKHKIPFDKVFTRTEQDKFAWAFEVDENYVF